MQSVKFTMNVTLDGLKTKKIKYVNNLNIKNAQMLISVINVLYKMIKLSA